MIPIMQKYKHRPDDGVYGDCHRACIASILELGIDDVPHFLHDGDQEKAHERINQWFEENELRGISIAYDTYPLTAMKNLNPGMYYILTAMSTNDVGHAVVCLEDQIVHNPAEGAEIVGPINGFYWIEVLVSPKSFK